MDAILVVVRIPRIRALDSLLVLALGLLSPLLVRGSGDLLADQEALLELLQLGLLSDRLTFDLDDWWVLLRPHVLVVALNRSLTISGRSRDLGSTLQLGGSLLLLTLVVLSHFRVGIEGFPSAGTRTTG